MDMVFGFRHIDRNLRELIDTQQKTEDSIMDQQQTWATTEKEDSIPKTRKQRVRMEKAVVFFPHEPYS